MPEITYTESPCRLCRQPRRIPDPASLRAVRKAAGLTLGQCARTWKRTVGFLSAVELGKKSCSEALLEQYRELESDV